jgi:hypothetical protein
VTTDNGKSFTCTLRFDTEVWLFFSFHYSLVLPMYPGYWCFGYWSPPGGACLLRPWWYSTICHQKDCGTIDCTIEMIAMWWIINGVNGLFSTTHFWGVL